MCPLPHTPMGVRGQNSCEACKVYKGEYGTLNDRRVGDQDSLDVDNPTLVYSASRDTSRS